MKCPNLVVNMCEECHYAVGPDHSLEDILSKGGFKNMEDLAVIVEQYGFLQNHSL